MSEILYGAHDLDFSTGLAAYFDFSKDEIINKDGSVAKFDAMLTKANNVDFTPAQATALKAILGKNKSLYILEQAKLENGTATVSDFENTLIINKLGYRNGMYNFINNALQLDTTSNVEDFPAVFTKESENATAVLTFDVAELIFHLKKLAVCVGIDDVRHRELTGVYFESTPKGVRLTSTNATVLYTNTLSKATVMQQGFYAIVQNPTLLVKVLEAFDDETVQVYHSKGYCYFVFKTGSYTTRLVDARYPDYKAVIPQTTALETVLTISELKKCLATLKAENKDQTLVFIKSDGKISVKLLKSEREELVELCQLTYTNAEKEVTVIQENKLPNLFLIMPKFSAQVDKNTDFIFSFNVNAFQKIIALTDAAELILNWNDRYKAFIVKNTELSVAKKSVVLPSKAKSEVEKPTITEKTALLPHVIQSFETILLDQLNMVQLEKGTFVGDFLIDYGYADGFNAKIELNPRKIDIVRPVILAELTKIGVRHKIGYTSSDILIDIEEGKIPYGYKEKTLTDLQKELDDSERLLGAFIKERNKISDKFSATQVLKLNEHIESLDSKIKEMERKIEKFVVQKPKIAADSNYKIESKEALIGSIDRNIIKELDNGLLVELKDYLNSFKVTNVQYGDSYEMNGFYNTKISATIEYEYASNFSKTKEYDAYIDKIRSAFREFTKTKYGSKNKQKTINITKILAKFKARFEKAEPKVATKEDKQAYMTKLVMNWNEVSSNLDGKEYTNLADLQRDLLGIHTAFFKKKGNKGAYCKVDINATYEVGLSDRIQVILSKDEEDFDPNNQKIEKYLGELPTKVDRFAYKGRQFYDFELVHDFRPKNMVVSSYIKQEKAKIEREFAFKVGDIVTFGKGYIQGTVYEIATISKSYKGENRYYLKFIKYYLLQKKEWVERGDYPEAHEDWLIAYKEIANTEPKAATKEEVIALAKKYKLRKEVVDTYEASYKFGDSNNPMFLKWYNLASSVWDKGVKTLSFWGKDLKNEHVLIETEDLSEIEPLVKHFVKNYVAPPAVIDTNVYVKAPSRRAYQQVIKLGGVYVGDNIYKFTKAQAATIDFNIRGTTILKNGINKF